MRTVCEITVMGVGGSHCKPGTVMDTILVGWKKLP